MAGCNIDVKAIVFMVLGQAILALANILYKLALHDGLPVTILVSYRFLFGAAVMAPLAIFIEWNTRPRITLNIIFYGFLCGLFGGALGQNLYLEGIALTSATFGSAMMNLIPGITFIVSICLRIEQLGWNTSAGKAKVFGTLMGIGGAMLLTFYKGPILNMWETKINLFETIADHQPPDHHQSRHDLVLGSLLSLASCASYSVWLIIQAKAMEQYPCPYSLTAMMTVWASILGVSLGVCTERDWSSWTMQWDIRLLAVAVGGILGSGVMFTLMAWCVRVRGPLFVAVFNPLALVMVAIAGSLLLEEKLHVGMLVGSIIIVGGLYVVLWGKGKERRRRPNLAADIEAAK